MTDDDTKAIPYRKNASRPAARPYQPLSAPISAEAAEQEPPDARTFPEAQAPETKPTRPTSLAEAYPWLLKPFRQADVELKPTATTKDKSRALATPYADPRVYFARLDKICGPENWSTELVFSERGAVCRLTIFGVTKSAAGDYPLDRGDENAATSAEAQAFKRACAAFGLGRYLYSLPQIWAAYDEQKKQIIDPAGIVAQMYAALPRNGDE